MKETPFIQVLKDAGVCGGKIYPVEASDNAGYPFMIYSVIRGKLTDDLDGSKGQRDRYLFTSWHDDYQDALDTLALMDSTILAGKIGRCITAGVIDKDPTTENWRLTNNDWEVLDP